MNLQVTGSRDGMDNITVSSQNAGRAVLLLWWADSISASSTLKMWLILPHFLLPEQGDEKHWGL